jgi:hypothetical protein
MPLNGSAGGSVVGYDTVTVLYGENGENGKTVYNYHNEPDLVLGYNDTYYSFIFPLRPPYASNIPDPQNGNLLAQTDFKNVNGDFKTVNQTINTYNSNSSVENVVYGVQSTRITTLEHNVTCESSTVGSVPPEPCSRYEMSYRTLTSDWNYLSSTDVKDYDQNDDSKFSETVTDYFYENSNHMMPTKTVTHNSKDEIITTHTSYPLDFSTTANSDPIAVGIKYLQDNHVVNAPVETYTQKANANGSNVRTVSGVLNTYKTTSPELELIYDLETSSPLTSFNPLSINQSNVTMNSSYQQLIKMDSYDGSGNLLQQHKIDDVKHTYIWDYNSSLPVAEIINGGKTETAYTSFESNGTGKWSYSGSTVSDPSPPTGTRAYDLSAGAITTSSTVQLSASKKYIVSYWAKNVNPFTVTGTVNNGVTTGKKIGNYTYFEHLITGVTAVTVSFPNGGTGGTRIDELRLYPQTAQMTTYTFEPLIGMTSQCDANNKISYYEYDGLGRLKLIRDQDKYIIKQFAYKYQLYASSDPIWQATGITRCKPCTQNNNYSTNILQQQEQNINTSSSATTRWVDIGTSTACGLPDWQSTSTVRCQVINTHITGYQEIQQTDMNPCSGQGTRWVLGNYNTSECHNQCSTCTGDDKKCINGVCETGSKIYYAKKQEGNVWTYWYRYWWSDCSSSIPSYSDDFNHDPDYDLHSGCFSN